MPAPELVHSGYGGGYQDRYRMLIKCPTCGRIGWISQAQYEGQESIDCPECDYEETHDLSEED